MLAELLNNVREQAVGEIEQRAETIEGPGLPSAGRKQRLNSLLDELIAALRYGGVDEQAPPAPAAVDSALDIEERELVRRYVIEQIEQRPAGSVGDRSGGGLRMGQRHGTVSSPRRESTAARASGRRRRKHCRVNP